jgi:phosphopantetheinyl transferase (holo-ACP synthase)
LCATEYAERVAAHERVLDGVERARARGFVRNADRDRYAVPESVARCWSRKEAYLKGVGIGLAEGPSVAYVAAGHAPAVPADWSLADVRVASGYAAACAIRTGSYGAK